jgi:hypothetical protein
VARTDLETAEVDPSSSNVTWQLGITDVDAASAVCERLGLAF